MLDTLTTMAPGRISGSVKAAEAVLLAQRMMLTRGFANVHTERVIVPHWVRGDVEDARLLTTHGEKPLAVCALGSSVATPPGGVTAEVIEAQTFEALQALGPAVQGKIVYLSGRFDPALVNTFQAYGNAVGLRSRGPVEAAKAGGVAVLVRSMTNAIDDVPHTGNTNYAEGTSPIPAAAISTISGDQLSAALHRGERVKVRLRLDCRSLPDVESANVMGEISGSEHPEEIIVVGGHLDAWDKGTGAHDDGAGCVQSMEALNLLRRAGLHPRKTIRCVLFMNEENGLRGGRAYPVDPGRRGEMHVAAIESDRGGFSPRGFTVQGDSSVLARVVQWRDLFERINAGTILPGGSGSDVSPLAAAGVPSFGLLPEDQRYFDYHHSDNDTIDKVHPRELELGAIALAVLCWQISEEGLHP